jgi:RimJ/RimL family protein N-acetyltransferase
LIEIITGWDAALTHWVSRELGVELGTGQARSCAALGFAEDGRLLGAVVYHSYRWPNIEAALWTESPRWCSRRSLFALFCYPFRTLECRRFGATVAATNQPARDFVRRLGFTEEGCARRALCMAAPAGPGAPAVAVDAVIYGMLAEECPWLKGGR